MLKVDKEGGGTHADRNLLLKIFRQKDIKRMCYILKKSHHLTAIALVLCLCLSFSINCFAANTEMSSDQSNTLMVEFENGLLYYSATSEKKAAAVTIPELEQIHVSISYGNNENEGKDEKVMEWILDNDEISVVIEPDQEFFLTVISYCEKHPEKAHEIVFEVIEESINQGERSSAIADLTSDLERLEGDGYLNRYLLYRYFEEDGATVRIYEDHTFEVKRKKQFTWSEPLSVSSIIVGISGAASANTISLILGGLGFVVDKVTGLILKGSLVRYQCDSTIWRYATVNGSNYRYNVTYRCMRYDGYENPNGIERAYVATDTKKDVSLDLESYFNDLEQQAEDARKRYITIGQQP